MARADSVWRPRVLVAEGAQVVLAAAREDDVPTDIPLRRYGDPVEFGRVAAFVLSPAASYLTGAMVPVDGGATRAL